MLKLSKLLILRLKGTHCTKMGADKLAKNTTNAPKFICPSPKVWDFHEKRLHWASVVRAKAHKYMLVNAAR